MSYKTTQEFNEKNSLYQVLFTYLINNEVSIFGTESKELTGKTVRKLIFREGVLVNSIKKYDDTYKVQNNDILAIPKIGVQFMCVKNLKLADINPQPNKLSNKKTEIENRNESANLIEPNRVLDIEATEKYINEYFEGRLQCSSINEIFSIDTKKAFCSIITLFEVMPFDEIKHCESGRQIINFIKENFINSYLPKELNFSQKKLSFSGFIIDSLLKLKAEKKNEIRKLFDEAKSGLYDKSLNKFHQNYNRIITKDSFQYLISPLLDNNISSRIVIENLTKPILDADLKIDNESRYSFYDSHKKNYEDYINRVVNSNDDNKSLYFDIGHYLFNLFKIVCDATVEKAASLFLQATPKRYNFQNSERPTQDIFLNIKNIGEGLAKDVIIKSVSDSFEFSKYYVGLLKPGELREITIQTKVNANENFNAELKISILWEEPAGKKDQDCLIKFDLQDINVPWDTLSKQSPYSIQIIEEKSKLYGRDEILEELQSNILSYNIESYKIWGQKRVGKSSIVKTLKSIFNDSENVLIIYRIILGLRNPDPLKTLNDLGESICSEILTEIENKIKSSTLRDQLKNISIPMFSGSFYPLEKFISKLHSISSELKFIFIIDEFDRINEEFFKASDLGEGFSGSIGKALNEYKYIGFILVGSENMQLLEKQGMNYNSYLEREVDTFKKETQYSSFKNIVLGPVSPYISFSEDSIERIFEVTNGNPYFTNLICKEAFKIAHRNRDAFLDIHLINDAIDLIVKSSQKSHFEHFWGDGLAEEGNARKDRTTDIRRRILVRVLSFIQTEGASMQATSSER